MGWSAVEVERVHEQLDGIASGLTLAQRLTTLLGDYRIDVLDGNRTLTDVPVFRFGAPRVPGIEVTYQESFGRTTNNTWLAKVFPIGIARSVELHLERDATYTCAAGDCVEVFARVRMKIERVRTFRGRHTVGEGFRATVAVPKGEMLQAIRSRGARTLKSLECSERLSGAIIDEIRLDTSGLAAGGPTPINNRWQVSASRQLELALKGFDVSLSPIVKVSQTSAIQVSCSLPAGRRYAGTLHTDGLLWSEPRT